MRIGDTFMGQHHKLCGLAHITWPVHVQDMAGTWPVHGRHMADIWPIVTLKWPITAGSSASECSGPVTQKTRAHKRFVRGTNDFRAPDTSGYDAGKTCSTLLEPIRRANLEEAAHVRVQRLVVTGQICARGPFGIERRLFIEQVVDASVDGPVLKAVIAREQVAL